jgi:hypothetical protein
MACIQRLLLVRNLLFFNKKEALALDLNIVVLLLGGTLAETSTTAKTSLCRVAVIVARVLVALVGRAGSSISNILALLLLFLLALLAPDLINVEKLNGDQIAFESTVAVLGTANEDISIKEAILGSNVGVATVLLVDTENTRDELAISQKSGERSLGEVGGEEGLPLLLLLLAAKRASML